MLRIRRIDIGYMAFIVSVSFVTKPNAFIHPIWSVIMWIALLYGINAIHQDNKSQKRSQEKSKRQLKSEIRKKEKEIEGLKALNESLFKVMIVRSEEWQSHT